MSKFQKGDVVCLKSGGPKLTVNYSDSDEPQCAYFLDGEIRFVSIAEDALEKID